MGKNKFDLEQFNELKKSVETEYKKIGSIYNPALRAKIFFNPDGWHHLRYNHSRSERSKSAQKSKLVFFNSATNIIKMATTIQEYRRDICHLGKNKNRKGTTREFFAFWAIISFTKKIRIKVIIKRIGGENGQFHFWSVMPFWRLSDKQREVSSENIMNE